MLPRTPCPGQVYEKQMAIRKKPQEDRIEEINVKIDSLIGDAKAGAGWNFLHCGAFSSIGRHLCILASEWAAHRLLRFIQGAPPTETTGPLVGDLDFGGWE